MINDWKSIWRKGEIIGYPTESYYALGVKATDATAIKQLFLLKHREAGKPVALIAADLAQVKKYFYMLPAEIKLARKYWPGPLTILLRPKVAIAARALAPTPSYSPSDRGRLKSVRRPTRIGVRVPAHAGARRLAAVAGAPITATSANLSGHPPTKSAAVVKRQFPGIMIITGRCGKFNKPSTVVERRGNKWNVIRPGSINI